ncbi:MAG: ABC transporter substrate-binding protein, partial [Rhizobiales bacterium]|nr:ABC transporter substrate-binding protein [Hyphomicrobiales bacterium]
MATKMVARIAVAVLGIAGVLMHAPGAAYAAEVKKVTIVLSTTDQDVSYQPYGPFAQQMGWYKDEGLDVTIQTASNSGQVIQLLLTGQAQ